MTLTATIEDAGKRLDAFVAERAQGVSRSAAARLIAEGNVTVNGKAADKNDRLAAGDTVAITIPEAADTAVTAQEIPLDVVYEDEDVIVVNKPVGMVVHPAPGHPDGTLVNALLHHCGDSLSGIGGEKRPGIVHRIDRDTSGLIIAAKNDAAHLALSAQLADHTLARTYECIVTGTLREERHRGRPHRPPSQGPEEDGGGHGGQAGRDPLGGAGPLPGCHPRPLPIGDGPHPPDPRPHGQPGPPPAGGHGVRQS